MKMKSLHDLLVHELKDLYSAETQLTKALPKMAKAASNDDLRDAIESHLHETEEQIARLDQIFEELEIPSGRIPKCKAMEGLIQEGDKMAKDSEEPEVCDAAIIAAAQRVEHYEMAGYGCARTYAAQLGFTNVARLLQQTLEEEAAADEKLTQIAMGEVNAEAAMEGE
jgi:ferritin-like metal-binding protein YciE